MPRIRSAMTTKRKPPYGHVQRGVRRVFLRHRANRTTLAFQRGCGTRKIHFSANMERRDFVRLLAGAAAAWPLAARAQQSPKLPPIGFLGAATPLTLSEWTAAFVQRLRELGWVDGRTVSIEYRWAEGRNDRYTDSHRVAQM
jgi:hypothetical protein